MKQMKKTKKQRKNRKTKKGFTLVELLAVIVILAIVVGITLVTVLPTLQKTRQKAFELSAETAAEFLEKQYQLSLLGPELAGDALVMTYNKIPKQDGTTDIAISPETNNNGAVYPRSNYGSCTTKNSSDYSDHYETIEGKYYAKNYKPYYMSKNDIINAGLKPDNYIAGTWYINTKTGRACVKLYAYTKSKNNMNNYTEYEQQVCCNNGTDCYSKKADGSCPGGRTLTRKKNNYNISIYNLNQTQKEGEYYDALPSVGEENIETICVNVAPTATAPDKTKKITGNFSVAKSSGCTD